MECRICHAYLHQAYHRGGYICPNGHWNDVYRPMDRWTLPPKLAMERKEILAGIRNPDGSLKNPNWFQRSWIRFFGSY